MNWEAIGAVVEIVGAIAVVLSLLYLAVQTKQSARAMRSLSFHQVRLAMSDTAMPLATDPVLTPIISNLCKEPESLTAEEVMRCEFLLLTIMRRSESAFYQSVEGTLGEESWIGILETCVTALSGEISRNWWERTKHRFEKTFREAIDAVLENQQLASEARKQDR